MAMLQGSIVNCQLSDASQQECEDKRQFLKSQLRLAWSGEAVKQGVAHAKKAEYDMALGCYKKVHPHTLALLPSVPDTQALFITAHTAMLSKILLSKLCCPSSINNAHSCAMLPPASNIRSLTLDAGPIMVQLVLFVALQSL